MTGRRGGRGWRCRLSVGRSSGAVPYGLHETPCVYEQLNVCMYVYMYVYVYVYWSSIFLLCVFSEVWSGY